MRIALTADHRGMDVVGWLRGFLIEEGHELVDVPTCHTGSCDYPDMAWGACCAVVEGRADRGILICGSGVGMSIAANKVKGIRAAVVYGDICAELSRRHNDANVLCLSADMLGQPMVGQIVKIWLSTEFEGGRHTRRVRKIEAIERGEDPTKVVK